MGQPPTTQNDLAQKVNSAEVAPTTCSMMEQTLVTLLVTLQRNARHTGVTQSLLDRQQERWDTEPRTQDSGFRRSHARPPQWFLPPSANLRHPGGGARERGSPDASYPCCSDIDLMATEHLDPREGTAERV